MKRFVILSDINGQFIPDMTQSLASLQQFDVVDAINCVTLAGIDEDDPIDIRHDAFKAGVIDVAAGKLIERYPNGTNLALGLSVGGVILWRAALNGLKIGALLCLSSTRLRFEKVKPGCKTNLYYGELDPYRPDEKWFSDMNVKMRLIQDEGHDFYRTSNGIAIVQRELENYL